ncbi:MAG: hypothetical protein UU76_C0002G0005 [Parcubacteria group bacterium GW2011_GWC1_41_7]|nr:MAG: hypothetical protein UU76_C0002G0005 [Parcubacteria group bacterium GW2011_GWC1_41_7]
MDVFSVSVLHEDGEERYDDIVSVTIKTPSGEISVLAHHHPLVTIAKKGTVTCKTKHNGAREIILARDSIFKVSPEGVMILTIGF